MNQFGWFMNWFCHARGGECQTQDDIWNRTIILDEISSGNVSRLSVGILVKMQIAIEWAVSSRSKRTAFITTGDLKRISHHQFQRLAGKTWGLLLKIRGLLLWRQQYLKERSRRLGIDEQEDPQEITALPDLTRQVTQTIQHPVCEGIYSNILVGEYRHRINQGHSERRRNFLHSQGGYPFLLACRLSLNRATYFRD
ncbi:hypothetical protein CPB86DRAFT_828031 [Serendipita vermifera]|nr:hypothetical protein CPB86DRAFT_828031 [Serendipita vermifera]